MFIYVASATGCFQLEMQSYIIGLEAMHPAEKHKQFVLGFRTIGTFEYQESMLDKAPMGPRRQHFLFVNAEPTI